MKLEDYKKYPAYCCVYEIHNTITNKKYIGSCINLHDRFSRHVYQLNHNIHHSQKFQRAFNKYGISNFEVNILKKLENVKKDLEIFEEKFIREYDCVKNGYNCVYTTKHFHGGYHLTQEQIDKSVRRSQKSVVAINRFNGEKINTFESISKAAKFYHTSTSNISRVCTGKLNYIKDCIFRYTDEYNGEKLIYDKNHNKGVSKSLETRNRMIKSSPKSIITNQYDLNMNFITSYFSLNQCIKATLFGEYKIKQAIKNKTPLNGYFFIQDNKI